ncbi:MAG: cell division ATP-binding protein FtsE [Thermodesulfobacteriota bacterium]
MQMYNVYKTYGKEGDALVDINLRIDRGDFVFVTGPSGAGKTTLLKLLFCEERPTRGQLLVDGRNLLKLKRSHIPYLRRNIGIVFQDFKLFQERSVYDNVAFALEVIGTPAKEIRRKVIKAIDLVGLLNKLSKRPNILSGGEQQRIAIARALVKEPKILLADEPTGNLDPDLTKEVIEIFKQVYAKGTTIVVATHNISLLNGLQRRVIALNKGRIN